MEMKDEDKWIEELRRRMEDYSEPLPDGLWEDLEKELNAPKVIPFRRMWYAAAVVLVLLASSLAVWFWSSPVADFERQDMMVQEVLSRPSFSDGDDEGNLDMGVPGQALAETLPPVSGKQTAVLSPGETGTQLSPMTVGEEGEASRMSLPVESVERTDESETDRNEGRTEETVRASRAADRERMRQNAYQLRQNRKNGEKEKFSVGLLAGNTPYSSSNTYNGMMGFVSSYQAGNLMGAVNDKATALGQNSLENQGHESKTNIKHHMPVTVGASFRWALNEDWALETGLMYTLLSTDWRSGAVSYMEYEQKLHYVGIPLKVQRSIWKNNRFAFYASAGGAVEKCVSTKLKTIDADRGRSWEESLDVDPLQWSVTAAVGAQVNFTPQLGLYLEPGIAYYFDDNSSIETIRKEHPLNFNLQLGLRFSVGR